MIYSDDYDYNYIHDQNNSSAYDEYDNFVYMCNLFFCHHISHIFSHGLVCCARLYFCLKTTTTTIRRSAVGKVHIFVMYVIKYTHPRSHYVDTRKRTIQMM